MHYWRMYQEEVLQKFQHLHLIKTGAYSSVSYCWAGEWKGGVDWVTFQPLHGHIQPEDTFIWLTYYLNPILVSVQHMHIEKLLLKYVFPAAL